MTREEVINQLNKLKSFHNGSYGEAINFAIESIKVDMVYNLEYEQVESDCDDYISRQEAINALGECPMNWTDTDAELTAERDWKNTIEMLKSLPSVKPEVKEKGHWAEDVINGKAWYSCSKCLHVVSNYEGCFHYCPYCGAELKGVVRHERTI